MKPFATTTVHFGYLVTNREEDFVVLDGNCTVVHESTGLGQALSWAKEERTRLDGKPEEVVLPVAPPDETPTELAVDDM